MKTKIILGSTLVMLSVFLISCKSDKKVEDTTIETEQIDTTQAPFTGQDGHNSRNSVDWPGEYKGIIPCADCSGIEITVVLNADGTFTKTMLYQDKGTDVFKEEGSFTWNESGSIVSLQVDDEVSLFKVQEGSLLMLDQEGEVITGDLANMYILTMK